MTEETKRIQDYKVLNMKKQDIVNMILGGIKPNSADVSLGIASITGTPKVPVIKWNQLALMEASVRFLLKLYRNRAHRRTVIR